MDHLSGAIQDVDKQVPLPHARPPSGMHDHALAHVLRRGEAVRLDTPKCLGLVVD
jgi:hypothetical protein